MTLPTDDLPLVDADADAIRNLLRHQASTVTVVTAAGPPAAGFTATSFTSVSLAPPVVSFCLNLGSSSSIAVSGARHVGVHLLAHHQQELARRPLPRLRELPGAAPVGRTAARGPGSGRLVYLGR
ncbi:flavin reductase family protein [Micromonospora sp. WMMD1082]|nr:flavin reductase family protein [Micromonospora sp. WMMD1082]MDG4797924.1 flavin reductase family protein [Micromonospora sp. WMMD1082]